MRTTCEQWTVSGPGGVAVLNSNALSPPGPQRRALGNSPWAVALRLASTGVRGAFRGGRRAASWRPSLPSPSPKELRLLPAVPLAAAWVTAPHE